MNRLNIQLGNPICAFVAFIYVLCAFSLTIWAMHNAEISTWALWVIALIVCVDMRACEAADSTS